MKKKQSELIKYLSENNKPVNSKELAHALNSAPLKTMYMKSMSFMEKISFYLHVQVMS